MTKRPTPSWSDIANLARQLGATEHAVAKWRQRGVPARWQIRLASASKGAIRLDDFTDQEETAA